MSSDECCECGKKVPHRNRSGRASHWDFMRAEKAGWFFKRDGQSWCPEHVPAWVEGWRAKQAAKRAQIKQQREILAQQDREVTEQ